MNRTDSISNTFHGLSDMVVIRLREAILSGHLRDGQRIVEQEIAAEYGTSRGPIRDALRQLEIEGLVTRTPRRGAYVTSLSQQDAIEVLAIREAIEPVAVRFLLQQQDPSLFHPLEECLNRLEEAARRDDWPSAVLLDMEFHTLIYHLSGQRRLQRIWESLRTPLLQTFRLHRQFYPSIKEVPQRHRLLFDVLRSGDGGRAETEARLHVVEFQPQLLESLAQLWSE